MNFTTFFQYDALYFAIERKPSLPSDEKNNSEENKPRHDSSENRRILERMHALQTDDAPAVHHNDESDSVFKSNEASMEESQSLVIRTAKINRTFKEFLNLQLRLEDNNDLKHQLKGKLNFIKKYICQVHSIWGERI